DREAGIGEPVVPFDQVAGRAAENGLDALEVGQLRAGARLHGIDVRERTCLGHSSPQRSFNLLGVTLEADVPSGKVGTSQSAQDLNSMAAVSAPTPVHDDGPPPKARSSAWRHWLMREIGPVAAVLVVTVGLWLFLVVADEMGEGDTNRIDHAVLYGLRQT